MYRHKLFLKSLSTGRHIIILCLLFALLTACATPAVPLPPTLEPTATNPPANPPTSTTAPVLPTFTPTNIPALLPAAGPTQESLPLVTKSSGATIHFAVIGDYGANGGPERDVADLIKSWNPDFIITTGDNNYPAGSADTIDLTIGQFFHEFIYPYQGSQGEGSTENRFFPSLGNHDWMAANAQPYLDYFTLDGNERYYDFTWGPVHFFALDSDSHEPDGVSSKSVQAMWLKEKLAASTSPWNLVYMHHPPYSSGLHGPTTWMRWPFKEWGASAVLSGHDHTYERLLEDGLTYFVDGLGGSSKYDFVNLSEGSQVRYNADYGAMFVSADQSQITFQFINRKGEVIDTYSLTTPR